MKNFEEESTMPETIGTLNLKIARLEQRLQVLKKQQGLSSAYPNHQTHLKREYLQLEAVLYELIRRRQEFSQTPLAL
jgi:hypothetical protein